jgi:hypothetical protein
MRRVANSYRFTCARQNLVTSHQPDARVRRPHVNIDRAEIFVAFSHWLGTALLESTDVRPLGFYIDSVQRLTGRHEQTISFWTAEAYVATNLRQEDLSDALPVRRHDVHAIVPFANPARTCPNVSIDVSTNAISAAGERSIFHLLLHYHEFAPVT